jgi:thymidylate synthase
MVLDFSINDNHILKLRKMYYKGVEGEFKTLIDPTPLTNISQLEANGCNYWRDWSGPDGSINIDYHNQMHPQLGILLKNIKRDPHSRRHVLSLWNSENVEHGTLSLACCWWGLTFSIINDTVHLTWIQRSVDTMVGLPSDIYLAYKFMELVSNECGLKMGTCMFSLSNVHIYREHFSAASELLNRDTSHYDKPLYFRLKV